MTPDSPGDAWIPESDALRELAHAGALCESCGGLCTPTITIAILLLNAARQSETKIPWCHCEDCKVCGPFHEAVLRNANARRKPSTDRGIW